jgi:hypothetical protein
MWRAVPPIVHTGGKTLQDKTGESYIGYPIPPAMTRFPLICESCTVRAILGRELTLMSGDIQLLILDRMRLIDMAHAWASSTLQGGGQGTSVGSTISGRNTASTQPPQSSVIPLLWGVLEYTLQTSRKTVKGIKYNTARNLQSAVSAYHFWEKMLQFPGHMYRDRDNMSLGLPICHLQIVLLPHL